MGNRGEGGLEKEEKKEWVEKKRKGRNKRGERRQGEGKAKGEEEVEE